MKTDFMIALTQLAAERNLPKEVIIKTLEVALVPVFKKASFAPEQEVVVRILPTTGEVKVYAQKTVVRRTTDSRQELTLAQARKLKPDARIGDVIEVECPQADAGRIAAQTAKQVILQRLREAERDAIFGEYADKEGDIVSGTVHVIEPKQIVVDIGRAEAILPQAEQVNSEHYRVGQRLKLYLMRVVRTSRGTQLVVSRTHQNLIRRLFELEVPEVYNGTVEIKSLAREPGHRSKVAVAARQEGVDAVGCCLGLRSIRIQNIIRELNGEKIDVIQWHPDPAVFIASALSPAAVIRVDVGEEEKSASVVVPDRQLSLAIGKGGQNARLAARLTGWRIDIKSASMVEAEKPAEVVQAAEVEELAPTEDVAAEAEMPEVAEEEAVEAALEAPEAEAAEPVTEAPAVAEAEAVAEAAAAPQVEEAAAGPEVPEGLPVEEEVGGVEAPAPAEEVPRTYSVEEILSEIEVATERIQRRYGGRTTVPKLEITTRKGKKVGASPEEPGPKPKAKRAVKRRRVSDEDLELDEGTDSDFDFEAAEPEDEGEE